MDPGRGGSAPAGSSGCSRGVAGPLGREQQGWKRYAIALLAFNAVMFVDAFAFLALQQHLPLNPDGEGRRRAEPGLQHGRLVHLEHEPAALLGRGDDELPLAALRAHVAAVRLRGDWHRRAGGAGARAGRPQGAGQLLRRPAARDLPGPAAPGARRRDAAGARRHADDASPARRRPPRSRERQQTIARGPVAAFVAIKQLGTNGGGFFGPNSTHPFENPTFWTNALAMIAIILIPMACVWMFGRIVGRDAPRGRRLRRDAGAARSARSAGAVALREGAHARLRRAPRSSRWTATSRGRSCASARLTAAAPSGAC